MNLSKILTKCKLWHTRPPTGSNNNILARHEVDLRGANLRGIDLQGANLRGIDLQGANLRGIDLQGIDLRGTILNKTKE